MLIKLRKSINHVFNQFRQKQMAGKAEGEILDVGCSNIQNKYINPENTTGIDIYVPKKSLYKVVKADLNQRFPLKDNTFDTILAGDVIEHLQNTTFVLSEFYRVLKPGGKLIITVPNGWYEMFLTSINKSRDHLIIFSPRLLKRLLTKANFKRIKVIRLLIEYLVVVYKD